MTYVQMTLRLLYCSPMEVTITQFRAELRSWLARVADGQDVVVTERGRPVARLVAISTDPLLDRWERDGLITPASASRPRAGGARRATARGSVAELVTDLRR